MKKDPELVGAIISLKKTNPLFAKELSRPKRKWPSLNLDKIDKAKGDVIVFGKVLGSGTLNNPKKIVGWSCSTKSLEKIKQSKGEFVSIVDEINKNPGLKGFEVLK